MHCVQILSCFLELNLEAQQEMGSGLSFLSLCSWIGFWRFMYPSEMIGKSVCGVCLCVCVHVSRAGL